MSNHLLPLLFPSAMKGPARLELLDPRVYLTSDHSGCFEYTPALSSSLLLFLDLKVDSSVSCSFSFIFFPWTFYMWFNSDFCVFSAVKDSLMCRLSCFYPCLALTVALATSWGSPCVTHRCCSKTYLYSTDQSLYYLSNSSLTLCSQRPLLFKQQNVQSQI